MKCHFFNPDEIERNQKCSCKYGEKGPANENLSPVFRFELSPKDDPWPCDNHYTENEYREGIKEGKFKHSDFLI